MEKLAIVTSHPIQYNAPFFRLLNSRGNIQIKVFYTWSQSVQGPKYDPGFAKKIEWDIPLLDGYDYTFANNIATDPGTHHFKGIVNPTLNREIEQWAPNSILIYGWSFHSHLRCIRYFHKKIPIIFRGDSTLLAEHLGIKKIFRTLFLKWVYKHVDCALYVGTNNKLYYLRHGLKEYQLYFAPHAVDNKRFYDDNSNYEDQALLWRKKLNISDDDIVFMFAGKLETKKNPQLLIKSFLEINDRGTKLIIVGNGIIEKPLKKKYSHFPNISFLDFQNQTVMPVIYRMCNVFILSSKGPVETWGLSINEAMACSRAVLVSEVCGCAVDLVKDGINGYIFNSNNKKYLTRVMKKTIADKTRLKTMGEESLRIIKVWSFENICKQLESIVLHKAINNGNR
jgi:glycosyltransferase involved in cell wall biosynthesis